MEDNNTPPNPLTTTTTKYPRKNPFEPDPFNPVRGEQALWRAVITQALMDASSKSLKPELVYHRNEAIHWLIGGGSDFATVCQLAGLDPDYARRMAKRALARNCKWRNAPGEGRKRKLKKNRTPAPSKTEPPAEEKVIPLHRYLASV